MRNVWFANTFDMRAGAIPINGAFASFIRSHKMDTKTRAERPMIVTVSLDGNRWCVLFGENLQEGIFGFGETQPDAFRSFAQALDESGVVI